MLNRVTGKTPNRRLTQSEGIRRQQRGQRIKETEDLNTHKEVREIKHTREHR